ncbi:hypothetical protein JCM1841_001441 [Sporobolomyces salmonicolor]
MAAVSGFTDNTEPYSDTPGWEQKSGEFKSVTVPSTWNGRIWGRRACTTDSSGTLNCVAGGCSGGLDCGDGALGESTALERRLWSSNNGEYNVYDLQNGAGWSILTQVVPATDNCSSIACTTTLETCPQNSMMLNDSYGNGDYNSATTCIPSIIQDYDYFKTPGEHFYAYFQESRSGQPTVDYLCPSEGDRGYTVTFMLRASGTGKDSYSEGDSMTEADGTPTGTAVASPATLVPALTSAASVEASTAQTAAQTMADAAASSASTTSASPSNDPSASSSSSTSTILGVSTPIFAGIVGGAVIIAPIAITAICICIKKKRRQPQEGDVEVERDTATTAAAGQTAPQSGANPARTLSS